MGPANMATVKPSNLAMTELKGKYCWQKTATNGSRLQRGLTYIGTAGATSDFSDVPRPTPSLSSLSRAVFSVEMMRREVMFGDYRVRVQA